MDLITLGNQLGQVAMVAGALLDRVLKGGEGLSRVLEDALHGGRVKVRTQILEISTARWTFHW